MVLAVSCRISPVPHYSGYCSSCSIYAYGTLTPYGLTFQTVQLDEHSYMQSYNPQGARSPSLGSSLFARHYWGNHCYFLFLRVLRCFSSPRWLLFRDSVPSVQQVVPFGNLRIYRSCAAPRSLSQLTTSFFAS